MNKNAKTLKKLLENSKPDMKMDMNMPGEMSAKDIKQDKKKKVIKKKKKVVKKTTNKNPFFGGF